MRVSSAKKPDRFPGRKRFAKVGIFIKYFPIFFYFCTLFCECVSIRYLHNPKQRDSKYNRQ